MLINCFYLYYDYRFVIVLNRGRFKLKRLYICGRICCICIKLNNIALE